MEKRSCNPFRLIFMDINMPIMDGYSATEQIRIHVGKEKTRIVAASAYPRTEIEDRGKEVGMDDFIGKPISPDDVAKILNQYGTPSRI